VGSLTAWTIRRWARERVRRERQKFCCFNSPLLTPVQQDRTCIRLPDCGAAAEHEGGATCIVRSDNRRASAPPWRVGKFEGAPARRLSCLFIASKIVKRRAACFAPHAVVLSFVAVEGSPTKPPVLKTDAVVTCQTRERLPNNSQ